jgi:pimeloyl-ACP methyl ester carboxylesterase
MEVGPRGGATGIDALVRHRMIEVEPGVRLHVAEAGEGPPVILVHGFPEFWYSWRWQIPALAEAGFHVLAPDMRGYNLSDKPRGVAAYRLPLLTRDIARLVEECGVERACVVGHDWGAVVAWSFAMGYHDRLERLAILNVPHPVTFARGLRSPRQLLRSWYVFFFQIPGLPELLARSGNYRLLRNALRASLRRGSFSPQDVERYVEVLARPGALTSSINYYRALERGRRANIRAVRRVDRPVLVVWGEQDAYLGKELADPPREWVPDVRVVRLPSASHWVQNDEPKRVNQLLIDFLRG